MARKHFPVLSATSRTTLLLCLAVAGAIATPDIATAQQLNPATAAAAANRANKNNASFQVSGDSEQLEMIVNTSRILTLNTKVPRLLVQNQEIIQATPLSPNQIQVSALQPGVTALNLWDENDNIQVINVRVFGDVRELEDNLKSLFPQAKLKLRALPTSLIIDGYAPNASVIQGIIEVSEDYFPKVINRIQAGGATQVLLHVKVFEVSRTKLQRLGIDWAYINLDDFLIQNASGLATSVAGGVIPATGGDTVRFGVVNNTASFSAFINTLRQNSLAKIMAEPTLVTVSGRAARFLSGGQVPVPVSSGLGAVSIEYRDFGTLVDFVPIVLGNGMIKLEVRPIITEIDPSLRDPVTGTPGFRARSVDTSVELKAGQTMALAGLIQTRTDAERTGVPFLSDLPWVGAAFRTVQETQNEVELLIMITPELVGPLDKHEVPPCAPGQNTTNPSEHDLYFRGYIEVPKCCPDGSCTKCGPSPVGPTGSAPIYQIEEIPSPQQQSRINQPNLRGQVRTPSMPASRNMPTNYRPQNIYQQPGNNYRPQNAFQQPGNTYRPATGSAPVGTSVKPASAYSPAPVVRGNTVTGSVSDQNQFNTNQRPTNFNRPTTNNANRNNQYNTNTQYKPGPARTNNQYKTNSFDPTLIGPVGYEDIK